MYISSLLFIFGLIVGSFLNVLSLRYKPEGKIFTSDRVRGRSYCPKCKKTLRCYELIPVVSFAIQGGKCRSCQEKISWQYPVVELLTAFLTVAIPVFLFNFFRPDFVLGTQLWPFYLFIGLWLLIVYSLILLSLIDLRLTIIPDRLNIFIGGLAIGLLAIRYSYKQVFLFNGSFLKNYSQVINPFPNIWLNAIFAVIVAVCFFGLIILITKGRGMGLGDLKFAIPLGLLVGWPDILVLISMSFIIGSIFSIPLLITKSKGLKDGVPFGPFLVIALFVTIIYGEQLVRWYFSLV